MPTPPHLRGRSRELRFTVRRPPTGEVSPCWHRPSGGDVACSVHISVAPTGGASFALEDRLALAVPGCDVPARGASLRRIRSRHLLDPAQSLVLQACDQRTPAASADCAVEPTLLGDTGARLLDGAGRRPGHRPHIEILDSDHVEPPRKVSGGLLHPILTPIPLAGLQLRDPAFRLLAAVGTALATRQPLLQHLQPFRLTRSQTRCVQQFAGRQCGRHDNTAVDADHAAVTRARDRVRGVGDRDMPAASPITSHPVGLDTGWHWPRQAESHPPDLRHPYPTQAAVQPLDVMRFYADLPKPFVHTSFTPRRTAVCAIEQIPHRLREIPQSLLLHGLTSSTKPRVLGAGLRQLRALLYIAGCPATPLPLLLLLHRQIPHIPRVPAMCQQRQLLLRSRQQSKPRHIRTVTTDTDKPGHSTPPPFETGVFPRRKSTISSRWRHI